jgi:S1-C subfamily serine protease
VDAKIIGVDARADLALIKIEQTGLKALKIGNLDSTVVGQDVVAIGFALDLKMGEGPSFSVTRGIISAKNRAITEGAAILGAIQTDAAINHGNSGGPLLSLSGEVVGVNTAIAPDNSTGGIAPGIGFAVGADTVKAVYDEIRASGKVNRGLLGIQNFDSLRPARAKELGLSTDQRGVLLNDASVVAGQPAAAGGLKANDVITKISDYVIRTEGDLAVALIKNHAGDRVTVEFYRDGKKSSTQVTLGTPTT